MTEGGVSDLLDLMLDPVKNAQAVGVIIIFFGALALIAFLLGIFQSPLGLSGVVTSSGGTLGFLLTGAITAGLLAVGFGLRSKKQWAIWGLGAIALMDLISLVSGKNSFFEIIITAITVGLFIWFLSAKNKFS